MTMKFLDNFNVLILEESSTRQELLSDWISGVTTKTISSKNNIPAELDPTVTVACLSQTALGEDSESVQKYILSRNPYCQIVGIIPRSSFVTAFEDRFDEILQRPIFQETFQEIIESRFLTGVYCNLLSEIYHVNTELIALRRATDDEVHDREKFLGEIQERSDELNSQLDSLQEQLASDTILNALQTVNRHNRYLTKPETEPDEGRATKYRPRRCPSCKLPWGVNHRNNLGNGFTTLGADVYQCASCHKIVHGLAGEQRVL